MQFDEHWSDAHSAFTDCIHMDNYVKKIIFYGFRKRYRKAKRI